jgi:hypothetical protein
MTLIIQKPTGAKLNLAKTFTWNETVWNPSMITTALWLDAADASTVTTVSGAVSQWNDKSGNVRNFTQSTAGSRPAYSTAALNNLNTVTPDGSNDWMTGPVIFSDNQPTSYFIIVAYKLLNIIDDGVSNTANFLIGQTGSVVLNSNLYVNIAIGTPRKIVHDAFPPGGGSLASNTTITANTNYLTAFARNGDTREIWLNGASDASQSAAETYNGTTIDATNLFQLLGTNNATNANVGEIVAVAYPTTTNRQKLEGYLAHKWGLTANLPSDHPYKTVGPTP